MPKAAISTGRLAAGDALALQPDAVRETHCSRVLLQGDKAYKIRKPVRFAFVDQSSAAARRALAAALVWRARAPLAVVVCGPPGSGKSTLAAELARRSGFPVVASDLVRKARAGVAVDQRAPDEAYSSATTLAVYGELGERARAALATGDGGVIIDADASDADAAIAARLREAWHPLDEVPAARHVVLRADRSPAVIADELETRLDVA